MRPLRPLLALAALLVPLGVTALPAADARRPDPGSLVRGPRLLSSLRADSPSPRSYRPGEPVSVTGRLARAGRYSLRLVAPDGTVLGTLGPRTTAPDGTIAAVLPGEWTRGVRFDRDTSYAGSLAVEVVDVTAGGTRMARAGAAEVLFASPPPTGLVLLNEFTSAVGWVKPGETYPFRLVVQNYAPSAATGATVVFSETDGMTVTQLSPTAGSGTAALASGTVTWDVGTVPGTADPAVPVTRTLVVEARADSATEDPQIVWKNLSTVATLTSSAPTQTVPSHGPKVIPPDEIYETARYGDRPFPVVPVDFFDRKHEAAHSGEVLADKINSPAVEGSTFNLYQEMSYGQLFPHGTVPSAGIATKDFSAKTFDFRDPAPAGTCMPDGLVTAEALQGTPAYAERIQDGWYQLPGTTNYYGGDKTGSAILGSLTGQGVLFDIDSACGPTAKAVYDAATISDPEIDYSDYDTDKDGVVDFFMMVFVGLGGNGTSQLEGVPPYDNIWPHSSSLEFTYTDQATGLTGYISDDQLRDLESRPLWYTDDTRSQMTTTDEGDELKVFVRVGPYNVNPESSIDKASVISHEYGHSLGLPDFYSTGGRETYGDWNLMATDKSQNMDVFSKQDLGWIVPRVLPQGHSVASGWKDSKVDTNRIDWRTPGGTPYMLTGPSVHNGEAYTAKLPGRQIISPQKVEDGASATHVWWSGSGNNFGCAPQQAHNFDLSIPELAAAPSGATIKLEFASYWDIEWDYDYGFVLVSPDQGKTYASVASEKGYTTPAAQNPNANSCQTKYGNGITGTSGSYEAGTQAVDRAVSAPGGTQYPDGPFLPDSYDISSLAGSPGVVRFSYATDPGLAHPGWFVDDVKVTVNGEVVYTTDFEDLAADRPRVYNGGCQDATRVAQFCTRGWQYVASEADAAADHGYYLEMRDRSGFDFDGKNENDRDAIAFQPGLLLTYTDEVHGYGNAGTDDPPAQSPLDANPQPGESAPNLNDAAFGSGTSWSDNGHVDNYLDPSTESGNWEFRFGCLSFKVDTMDGDDVGPDSAPGAGGNLVGDVSFDTTSQCAAFNYGHVGDSGAGNVAPTAVAAAKPATAKPGQQVTFDASATHDDHDAPPDLTYRWEFGDGASASGRVVQHAYAAAGRYTATLRVTDSAGRQSTDTIDVVITAAATQPALPTTGAGPLLGFAAVGLLAAAVAALRLRRA